MTKFQACFRSKVGICYLPLVLASYQVFTSPDVHFSSTRAKSDAELQVFTFREPPFWFSYFRLHLTILRVASLDNSTSKTCGYTAVGMPLKSDVAIEDTPDVRAPINGKCVSAFSLMPGHPPRDTRLCVLFAPSRYSLCGSKCTHTFK